MSSHTSLQSPSPGLDQCMYHFYLYKNLTKYHGKKNLHSNSAKVKNDFVAFLLQASHELYLHTKLSTHIHTKHYQY